MATKKTLLKGVKVMDNPVHRLIRIYESTLKVLASMPKSSTYKTETFKFTAERMSIAKSSADVSKIESQLKFQNIEEIVIQSENELQLSRNMLKWKTWEPLAIGAPHDQWKWPIQD